MTVKEPRRVRIHPARARPRESAPASVAAIAVPACAGYLMANLLPAFLAAVRAGLGLSAAAAGAVGTAVLLGSAPAGAAATRAAGRAGRARLARIGLLGMVGGFAVAALTGSTWLAITGAVLGGAGSGIASAVPTAPAAPRVSRPVLLAAPSSRPATRRSPRGAHGGRGARPRSRRKVSRVG